MAESDTLKMFAVVLLLVIVALALMGCVENNAGQSGEAALVPIYDGSQAAAQQPGQVDSQASEGQYVQDSTQPQPNPTNRTRMQNSTQVQQAAIDACFGKSAGDSCALQFGSAGGPTRPEFNSTGAGSPPAGAAGPQGTPFGADGNATAPQGTMQQPKGTCEASESSVLTCRMAMPTGMPVVGG